MTLSGTKNRSFFAAATLVSVMVLCWSAEAAGPKQIVKNASQAISTEVGKTADSVTCYVYNTSDENICVKYDVYPVWYFSEAKRGTVTQYLWAKTGNSIVWAFPAQQASMQCKLVSARFMSPHELCQ